jgi:hypothetical protein
MVANLAVTPNEALHLNGAESHAFGVQCLTGGPGS